MRKEGGSRINHAHSPWLIKIEPRPFRYTVSWQRPSTCSCTVQRNSHANDRSSVMTQNFSLFDDPYKHKRRKSSVKAGEVDRLSIPKPPPKTCDEWLTSNSGVGHLVSADGTLFVPSTKHDVIKWPIHPPNLDYLVPAPPLPGEESKVVKIFRKHENPGDTILGTVDEIKEDLRKHARMYMSFLCASIASGTW